MRVVTTSPAHATVELGYRDLVLLYLGLVNAVALLPEDEFALRVGIGVAEADALLDELKPVVVQFERQERAKKASQSPP